MKMLLHNYKPPGILKKYAQIIGTPTSRHLKLKIVPPRETETHGTKNRRLGRFFSPHLSIYRPQLTSVMSISNRASSFLLSIYTWSLGIGALISSHDNAHFVTMLEGLQLNSTSIFILKFLIAFPFCYHWWASTRVLIWETGNFLSLKGIYATGYAALAATFVSAIGLASLQIISNQ